MYQINDGIKFRNKKHITNNEKSNKFNHDNHNMIQHNVADIRTENNSQRSLQDYG